MTDPANDEQEPPELHDDEDEFYDDEDVEIEAAEGNGEAEPEAGRYPGPEGAPRTSFVAVLGAPNAGKSTLVNSIVGTKVSIVSPKVQTTRTRIRGIAMAGAAQLVFIDTPGIFRTAKRRLERSMVAAAWAGAADADSLILVIDAARGVDDDTHEIIDKLKESGRKDVVLILNKVDAVRREKLLELSAVLWNEGIFSDVFMISALKGDGVADLIRLLAERAPEGPWMFPEDEVSDLPQRILAAEVTREKVFLQLHQELPYSVAVETDLWTENKDGSARIDQTIYVMRDNQRMIVLGKGGSRIRAIGQAARIELQELLGRRIHLFLHVKVKEQWAEDPSRYAEWGLEFDV